MNDSIYISDSKIHGKGIFTSNMIYPETNLFLIADLDDYYKGLNCVKQLGRYVNHQKNGNAYLKKFGNKFYLFSNRIIFPNEEITTDYTVLKKPFHNNINGYTEL